MIHFDTDKKDAGFYEINVTPFVDVVLVLLILFMIATPALMDKGLRISLPRTASGDDLTHVTLKIAVDRSGGILLDRQPVQLDSITRAVKKLADDKVNIDAILVADKEVPYGRVMEIVDHLRGLGIMQVGFGTEKKR